MYTKSNTFTYCILDRPSHLASYLFFYKHDDGSSEFIHIYILLKGTIIIKVIGRPKGQFNHNNWNCKDGLWRHVKFPLVKWSQTMINVYK